MPAIQAFSIPAGNALDVDFTMDPEDAVDVNLPNTVVRWQAFPQSAGVPDRSNGPLIAKDAQSGGIAILGSPPGVFILHLEPQDTAGLYPGNAYHEALVIDANGNPSTVTVGTMTITTTLVPTS